MDSMGTMMQMGGLGAKIGGMESEARADKAQGLNLAAQFNRRANYELGAGAAAGAAQAEKGNEIRGLAAARAASSGASGGPTISEIMGGINARTAANQGLELWKGQVGAQQSKYAGKMAIVDAENKARALRISELATGLSGIGTIGTKAGLFKKGTSVLDDDNGWTAGTTVTRG